MMGARRRIALINPPSERPILRDYYCSTRPKARYHWQPIDLLALAARLQPKAQLLVVDAVAEAHSEATLHRQLEAFEPDAIVGLVSTLTRQSDLTFLSRLSRPGRRIALSGEVALERDFDFERWSAIDGLILDFTAPEAADYLMGEPASGRVKTPDHAPSPPPQKGSFSLGPMPHELLEGRGYHMPLWGGAFRSLLTDFGCPYTCTFCNSGRHAIGYKVRQLEDVAADIAHLETLGTQRVYLRDMTFGARREHTLKVLDMVASKGWSMRGFTRADIIDEELARALAASGFELAQIGIETPHEARRGALGKKLLDAKLGAGVEHLHRHGIGVGAHFVVGFEGDDASTVARCVALAQRLDAAYLSINIYAHRQGCDVQRGVEGEARARLAKKARNAMWRYNGPRLLQSAVGRLIA